MTKIKEQSEEPTGYHEHDQKRNGGWRNTTAPGGDSRGCKFSNLGFASL